jgi:hypothetical protein
MERGIYIGVLPCVNDGDGSEETSFIPEGEILCTDAGAGWMGVTILVSFVDTVVGGLLGAYAG